MDITYYTVAILVLLGLCFYIARNFGTLAEFINDGAELTKQEQGGLAFLKSKKSSFLFLFLSISFMILSYFVFDNWLARVFYSAFSILLTASFLMDVSVKLLPDVFTISLLWLGLLASVLGITNITPEFSIISAMVMYIGFMFIDTVGEAIVKKEIIGGGDIKIMAAFGALFGLLPSIILLIIACAIMIVFVIGLKFSKKYYDKELPFGVGLTISALISLFCPFLVVGIIDYLMI
jgi:prepilin signal peptidase PulO-like enzyme (type II secretory pathway)